MKKTVVTLALISLQLFADEGASDISMNRQIGWGGSEKNSEIKSEPKVEWAKTFCNNEATFKMKAEYLHWATNFNLPYMLSSRENESQTQDGNDTFITKITSLNMVRAPLKWSSGARGTLGYHSQCDHLDVQAIYTYYQNKIHGSQSGDNAKFANSFLSGQFLDGSIGAQGHLKLTYNVGDLELGKTFFSQTTKALFRPFIALRGGWLDQGHGVKYTGVEKIDLGSGNVINYPAATSLVLDQDVWCIGPRIGIDMSWLGFRGFSLMVNFSTSLLYGKAHQKLAMNIDDAYENSPGINYETDNIIGRDKFMVLSPQLQGFIGLQWERCIENRCSVKLFAGWEANYWWEVSNVLFFNRPLSMQGLTAGLSFNF
ncbi:MAG TPA: Lpg1974 family pore-forming outer membrane protein [Rhabdochlamydiaceae bacterium]|nr:Lpg1974 family pore-forming outer membrane protein [Rhabdochlamydiaceae bacterium]